jgi:uncharacterized protein (TIGR01777 family)
MKIFMAGGTGFVGGHLTWEFARQAHEVSILTRKIRDDQVLPRGCRFVKGDPTERGPWQERIKGHDVVVNLAGSSIFQRWTQSTKKTIRESRVFTTLNLVEAFSAMETSPPTLISTSAVGYYGFHEDEELDEDSPPGDDFLADLSKGWESAALDAEKLGARVVIPRFGVVLGKGEGALGKMVPVFKKWLGSPLGSGEQWFSWIHIQDLVRVYSFILDREDISGPVNCTAPEPVRNKELTRALAEVLDKPIIMPSVPGFAVKLAMGEFGSVLLKGQKVLPARLKEMGFSFLFPRIRDALQDLLG